MTRILIKILLCALLLFSSCAVPSYGQEDKVDEEVEDSVEDDQGDTAGDEDTDSKVETEDEAAESDSAASAKDGEEEEEKPTGIRSSPDAETSVLFPTYPDKNLPAGKPIPVLIGFANKGSKDFTVETLDASFRYPQDYSYHIQNFTAYRYNRLVQPSQEVAFEYVFHPHESYGGRPFGLVMIMTYKDVDGNPFASAVVNETINFQEVDEGMDTETFFLTIFLAAAGLLVIFGINYGLKSLKLGKRLGSKPAQPVEMGTQQKADIDYDWLPKETTTEFSKQSPRRSPRSRRTKRSSGSGEE